MTPSETGKSKLENRSSKMETGKSKTETRVVKSFGSATGVPPGNGHGQDGRATPNDTPIETSGSIVVEDLSSVILEEPPAVDDRQSSIAEEPEPAIDLRPSAILLPLLLEVGCEEIPARFLRDAEKGLGERVLPRRARTPPAA